MGVPTSHIHFAPKQAQSFHKIYAACCSKTHSGGRETTQSLVTVHPRVSGDVTLRHDVSHAGLRAPDHDDGPPSASLTLRDHSLWPQHWPEHN